MAKGKKKADSTYSTIFEITSASIRAGIGRQEGGIIRIYNSISTPFILVQPGQYERYERTMLASLLETSMRLAQDNFVKQHAIKGTCFCVLSSPWFIETTRSILFKKNKPFELTRHMIEDAAKEEERLFTASLAKTNKELAYFTAGIERTLMHAQLNGYTARHISGRSTPEARLTYRLSETTPTLKQNVETTIAQVFSAQGITFATSTLVTHEAMRIFSPDDNHHHLQILIDGELTDVSLIENDLLVETQTFPHGTRSIIREMAQTCGIGFEEAESRMRLYASKKNTDNDAIYKVFEEALHRWSGLFVQACHELSQGTPLPNKAYVVCDPFWNSWYCKKIEQASVQYLTFRTTPIQTFPIGQEQTVSQVTFTQDQPYDVRLALDAISLLGTNH